MSGTIRPQTEAEREAEAYGIDLSLLESALRLTPEQRAERHQNALNLVLELKEAGAKLREKHKPTDRTFSG